jgi:hypothetical protein
MEKKRKGREQTEERREKISRSENQHCVFTPWMPYACSCLPAGEFLFFSASCIQFFLFELLL